MCSYEAALVAYVHRAFSKERIKGEIVSEIEVTLEQPYKIFNICL